MTEASQTYVIAEAGVNHNGSLDLALELVDCAAAAGADAVKFQTFQAAKLVVRNAEKAAYQQRTTGADESQFALLKKLELSAEAHATLVDHCRKNDIQFLSTPFDLDSVDTLLALGVPRLKVSSGDITNAPLLTKVAATGLPVILSTGMSTLGEVETALEVLAVGYLQTDGSKTTRLEAYSSTEGQSELRRNVTLLHCTTEYPAPLNEINLRAMKTLRETFGLAVGYSDHSEGIVVPVAAVAMGAAVIEKHFTLDKTLAGPDHQASLEPAELADMVTAIRSVETALGSPLKHPTRSERPNRVVARKSLVAARAIRAGDLFTAENLSVKRPGSGISALHYQAWLGKQAQRDYETDDLILP